MSVLSQGDIWHSCNNTEVAISGYDCFLWAQELPAPDVQRWSQTGQPLGDGPLGFDYSSQGGVFSHSHFLTRRKDCACHQRYMAQLHLLQTAKLHFNIRDAKISISLVRNGTTEAMLYSSDNLPSDDRPCLFLYQYHFSPSQILVWPLPSFLADCSSASNLCKLQLRRPKLSCTQLLSQNGCRIRP